MPLARFEAFLAKMATAVGMTMENGRMQIIITAVLRTASANPGVLNSLTKLSSPQNCGCVAGSMFQLKKLRYAVRSRG